MDFRRKFNVVGDNGKFEITASDITTKTWRRYVFVSVVFVCHRGAGSRPLNDTPDRNADWRRLGATHKTGKNVFFYGLEHGKITCLQVVYCSLSTRTPYNVIIIRARIYMQ